ncbi:DUF4845 domain-containing protein [Endozoicomonas sp. Mp262]|uniref:DUF4845 domain-containing protein n=1 Tax=Endozoicomonas sp. Mp262 TaxID=2919499 RepID=UPI0021D97F36
MPGKRQAGAGVLNLFIIIALILFSAMQGIKLFPYYLDDYAIGRVLASLDKEGTGSITTPLEASEWLERGLQSNNVELGGDEFRVSGHGDGLSVDINYERRVHFIYNIDFVLNFEHVWKVKSK